MTRAGERPEGLEVEVLELDGEALAVFRIPLTTRADPLSALTHAERAVVRLSLAGLSIARIGEARASSPRTVAKQLQVAYRKLGVGSRRELVAKLG